MSPCAYSRVHIPNGIRLTIVTDRRTDKQTDHATPSVTICASAYVILRCGLITTRRPASADKTARRQFQATGQPVSRTQARDAMTSRLLRCEATQVLQMRVGPFAFRYQGNGAATPCQYIDTTRKAIDCATTLPLRVFI